MGVGHKHPETHRVSGKAPGLSGADLAQTAAIWRLDTTTPISAQTVGLAAPSFADPFAGGYTLGGLLPSGFAATPATAGATRLTDDNSDIALGGPTARSEFNVTGAGIKVGILSDSFNLTGGMAADEANGNLPASVQILQEGSSGHDEGRAMADLVHKVAPGASIAFYSATGGENSFAAGIAALQNAGCNVIVDDVAYLNEPFYQDGGVVQQAVENAVADGVSYFTAASNEGTNYVEQSFAPMMLAPQGLPGGVVVQNFGTQAAPQPWTDVTLAKGATIELDMQWDQPFASIGSGSGGGASDSIGMALYNSAGQIVAITSGDEVGNDPVQTLTYTNSASSSDFRLVVFANGGPSEPGMFKIINYGNGTINNDAGTGSGTVIGHELVPGANTVGAVAYANTTAFGGDNSVEGFSSVGTGQILLNAAGQMLAAPESTGKVNFVAPDGSMTSVFAPFYGTSAAAPDAAAVAALMLQADPELTPGQVTQLLEQSAEPTTGPAMSGGAGLIQAPAAVQLALNLFHHS